MGGIFHFFDFNHGSMAKKILKHKRHDCGLEAPRNSLELQAETSQSHSTLGDLPYSYQLEEDWSGKNQYPIEASMKKLISEEISKQSKTRQNAPSIVARLMGMDALPLDTKYAVQPVEKKNDKPAVEFSEREKNGSGSAAQFSSKSNYSRQMELGAVYGRKERDANRLSTGQKFGKPRPREHPQEEELQKFKKEFEAWQAARFRECSKVVEIGSIEPQPLSQEKSNKEKRVLYANWGRATGEKHVEADRFMLKGSSHERGGLNHHRHQTEIFTDDQNELYSSRSRTMSRDFEQCSMIDYDQKLDTAPTRIVILKPGPDRIYDHPDSWTSSSGTVEERGSIEDFLEEVKERLKLEMQGKALKKSSVVRESGIETPLSEKPSDPKQIAKHIAKQVREHVTRDLGMNLLRSESTKSYRSEVQFNGQDSPEYINRDTRRFLSERLRNVLKKETQFDVPIVTGGSSRSSVFDNEKDGLKQMRDTLKSVNEQSYWEMVKDEQERQTGSFRHRDDDGMVNRELSPRNLIRSLSAPVSGTSFGKLLLEDRHILTGAQIRRKHEGIDKLSSDVRKQKKEKLNLKERVSNIRYSFTLRRRLFGKKVQSMMELHNTENDPVKDIMSGPTVMNFGERHENPTEVPPSPASFCSSTQEEFGKPVDHFSPLSTPDATLGEENAVTSQVFKEISSNLNELRRQLNELESDDMERTIEEDPVESEMVDLEDQAEAYIRDLLVVSGLYDGTSDKSLSRWDPLAKPISNLVFEQVEESFRKLSKENESTTDELNEKKVDHKILLDLLNEALSMVLGPPVSMSRFMRKLIGFSILPRPYGRKLLDSVWKIVRVYLYPPTDRSYYLLDSMVAQDLRSTPWSGLMDDEINFLGKEVECHIIEDLVEEIVKEMHS